MNLVRTGLIGILISWLVVIATSLWCHSDSRASAGSPATGFWKVTLTSPEKEVYRAYVAILEEGDSFQVKQFREGSPAKVKAASKKGNEITIEFTAHAKDPKGVSVVLTGKFEGNKITGVAVSSEKKKFSVEAVQASPTCCSTHPPVKGPHVAYDEDQQKMYEMKYNCDPNGWAICKENLKRLFQKRQ